MPTLRSTGSSAPGQVRPTRMGVAITAIVVAAVAGGAQAAHATTVDRYSVADEYEFTNWDCGYPLTVHGTSSSRVVVRSDAKEPFLYFSETYHRSETWTNEAGAFFTLTARGTNKDMKATPLGDDVYQAAFQTTGQPLVVSDSEGRTISRDRGGLRYEFTVDLKTGEFELLDVKIAAPHPGFETELCKIVAPLVGTDSADRLTPRPLGSTAAGMGYYEYLPTSYDANGAPSPVLIATNGYGENGDGSAEQLSNLLWTGIPRFIDVGGWPADRPLVVLATQHIDGGSSSPCEFEPWPGSCTMQWQHDHGHVEPTACTTPGELHEFIDYAISAYHIDPARIYLTGLSCGGFGVWEYLAEYGDELVAAAVPISAEGRPAWTTSGCGLDAVAIWAIHGELDDVVDPRGSIEPMTALAACPGVDPERARLTLYPDLGHEGWDQAYSGSLGDDIYGWMLQHKR